MTIEELDAHISPVSGTASNTKFKRGYGGKRSPKQKREERRGFTMGPAESLDQRREKISSALRDMYKGKGKKKGMDPYPYINDLGDRKIVYSCDGKTYGATYHYDIGTKKVVINPPVEVVEKKEYAQV